MGRRILITGNNAKYVHVHGKGSVQSDRNILMTGDHAEYVEVTLNSNNENK